MSSRQGLAWDLVANRRRLHHPLGNKVAVMISADPGVGKLAERIEGETGGYGMDLSQTHSTWIPARAAAYIATCANPWHPVADTLRRKTCVRARSQDGSGAGHPLAADQDNRQDPGAPASLAPSGHESASRVS